jgi:hypothetical protein
MKAQVVFKSAEKQFWLDMSERRAHNAYCMAGGKETWASYTQRRNGNRLASMQLGMNKVKPTSL